MTRDTNKVSRRKVLMSGVTATAGVAGVIGAAGATAHVGNMGNQGGNGGTGFTFTEPTVDAFKIVKNTPAKTETFQRGCGKGGQLKEYEFFHAVDSFDGDGETDRLYPHPSHKRFDVGDTFKINHVCETETGRDRPAYWLQFGPVQSP